MSNNMPNIILNTVREYENFITEEESLLLLNIAKNANDSDWFNGDPENGWYGKILPVFFTHDLSDLSRCFFMADFTLFKSVRSCCKNKILNIESQ